MTSEFRNAVVGLIFLAAGSAQAAEERIEIGEPLPRFTLKVANPDESGQRQVNVDKFFSPGGEEPRKATVISFFATWCEPCKKEMPFLAALSKEYKAKGLQVLLVSIDKETEKMEEARSLAKGAGVEFPVLHDRFNIVTRRFFFTREIPLPCVYVTDASGTVTMVNSGFADGASKMLLEEVRKQLGEPVSDPVPETLAAHIHANTATAAAAAAHEASPAEPAADDAASTKGKKKKKKKRRGKKKRNK